MEERVRRIFVPLAIFLLAFTVYQIREEHPPVLIADEPFYVRDARNFTNGIYFADFGDGPRPENYMHPPLGKLIIAAGLLIYGKPGNEYAHQPDPGAAQAEYIYGRSGENACGYYNPACADDARAWRLMSTLFGAIGVVAAYFVALQLFNRHTAGIFAAVLLLLDGIYFFFSRVGNLEVFAAAFTLLSIAFAFARWPAAGLAAGFFLGCAVATKGNAAFVLPVLAMILFMRGPVPRAPDPLATGARRAWEATRPWTQRAGITVLYAIVVPSIVYVGTHALFLAAWADMGGWPFAWRMWWDVQAAAFTFHQNVDFDHIHASPPLLWIPLVQPVKMWSHGWGTTSADSWAVGNPFLWWTAALALLVVPIRIVMRLLRAGAIRQKLRDLVALSFPYHRDLHVLLGGLLFWAAYLPFFLLHRPMFSYYMGFLVPFFAIFAGGLVAEAWDRGGRAQLLAGAYVTLAFAAFLYFLPVVAGIPLVHGAHEVILKTIPWMRTG